MSIKGESATKIKPENVTITIGRSNIHSVSHLVHKLDMYGYYEWLEIIKALKFIRPTYKKAAEVVLDKLIHKLSHHTKLPPLIKKTTEIPPSQKKRPSRRWTPNFIHPPPDGSFNLPREDTSMLYLELPGN